MNTNDVKTPNLLAVFLGTVIASGILVTFAPLSAVLSLFVLNVSGAALIERRKARFSKTLLKKYLPKNPVETFFFSMRMLGLIFFIIAAHFSLSIFQAALLFLAFFVLEFALEWILEILLFPIDSRKTTVSLKP